MLPRIACAAFVALIALPAAAQDYAEVKAKATSAFQAGNFDEAAVLFQEAFDLEPRGNLLYNIGLCYDKAGKTTEAVGFYQRYIEAVPNAKRRPAVVRRMNELKELLAGKYEQVSVTTTPPGAVIFVDEKAKGAMGQAPVDFKLLPGSYVIIAELPEHEPARRQIQLREGAPAVVDLMLVPSGSVGAVSVIVSESGAAISVDGRQVGKSPLEEPLRLRAGPHELTVSKPGFTDQTRNVEVAAGSEQRINVDMEGESGGGDIASSGGGGGGGVSSMANGIWPWVTMGAGVAAAGAGAFMALSAQDLHDQLEEKKKNGELIAQQDIDSGNQMVLMGNVLYGAGAAVVAGGVAWLLLGGDAANDVAGSLSTSVMVVPDGGYVGISGGF